MSIFDEWERYRRLIEQLVSSPAFQSAIETQRTLERIIDPAAWSAAKRLARTFESASASIPSTGPLLEQYGLAARQCHEIVDSPVLREAQRALAQYRGVGLPAVSSIAHYLSGAFRSAEAAESFTRTLPGEILDLLGTVSRGEEDDAEAAARELPQLLEQRLAKERRGPISLEGYIQLILAILFFLSQWRASNDFANDVIERLRNIEGRLEQTVEKSDSSGFAQEDIRVVIADWLRVRKRPEAEGPILAVLTENSWVRVLEDSPGWARVEYFDYLSGENAEGWVSASFLKPLAP